MFWVKPLRGHLIISFSDLYKQTPALLLSPVLFVSGFQWVCTMSTVGIATRAVESESEGFSTWEVGVVENFNDSDSGQSFCSPIVTVCATNVTLGNLSSFTLQQEMIMAIQTDGSALTCIPSLMGHSRSAASLGSSRNLRFVNATVRGLYHWNFHLLILVGTIVAPWRWLRNSECEFSWELVVHCYVTHVTEQW